MTDEGLPATTTRRTEPAERRPARPAPGAPSRRTSPRQFLHEVNVELRKVAWPTRAEVTNYATVVLIALVVLTSLIFGLDVAFGHLANLLFD